MEELKIDIMRHIRAYHKCVPHNWLKEKSIEELLCYTHPNDRKNYNFKIKKLNNERS